MILKNADYKPWTPKQLNTNINWDNIKKEVDRRYHAAVKSMYDNYVAACSARIIDEKEEAEKHG